MQNEEAATAESPKGQKPTHRLWIVMDHEGSDPEWTELATLWPTKKGTGFTGRLDKSNVFPEGARLVILPATTRKQGDAT